MKYFTKVVEVQAEELTDPDTFSLVKLEPGQLTNTFNFYDAQLMKDRCILLHEWLVKYPDGALKIFSAMDFKEKFNAILDNSEYINFVNNSNNLSAFSTQEINIEIALISALSSYQLHPTATVNICHNYYHEFEIYEKQIIHKESKRLIDQEIPFLLKRIGYTKPIRRKV